MNEVRYVRTPPIDNDALNALFQRSWPEHATRDFTEVLERSLTYVCAFAGDHLVGFVNVAWDGGLHAFLLDPTVDPDFRRRGIGLGLIRRGADAAAARGVEWLHVDFVAELAAFYLKAGFSPTPAGVARLRPA